MPLPTYNSAKHHIGLKETGGATLFGFMLEGGYVKEVQREQPGAPELGGSTDLIGQTPSLARWTQDDFVGGMYAFNWGRDDAMFADCTGFSSSPQSRSLISVPPVVLKQAIDSDTRTGWLEDAPRKMLMVGGSIYVVWRHTIARLEIVSNTVSWRDASPGEQFRNAEYDSTDQMIWILSHDTTPGARAFVRRMKTDLTDPALDGIYIGPSGTNGHTGIDGTIYQRNILFQIGRMLYSGVPPAKIDPSIAGVIKWRKIARLPGKWRDSVPFAGLLYILVNDGSFRSQIYAFDQDTVFPICEFPYNFYAKTMIEYAGRLFVGGTGTDVNGVELYAELYEVTGSSVRLVRTFEPETRNELKGGVSGEWPQSIDDLIIHEGLLWMGQKGKKLVAYDITSDGFFGASEIQGNANLNVARMTSGRGRIWMYCTDATNDANHGVYRIAQASDTPSAWNPTLVTSDFIYELAMKKRWSEIVVLTRYGAVSSIEYSVNSGETWTALTVVTETTGKVHYNTASLAAITPSKLIRFRIKLNSTTPSSALTYHRELVAFTVSFSLLGSTKKAWSFTINGSENIETRDAEFSEATVQAYDVSDVRDQLWGWMDASTPLTFRDVNGVDYSVKVEAFREIQPVIGPNPVGETTPEAHYSLTLLEV